MNRMQLSLGRYEFVEQSALNERTPQQSAPPIKGHAACQPPVAQLVIVVVDSVVQHLKTLLFSLQDQVELTQPNPKVHITIVNNDCGDACRELAAQYHNWITIVEPKSQNGYGAGVNFGAMHSNADWVIACNSDLIFQPSSLTNMVRILQSTETDIACVAPLLMNIVSSSCNASVMDTYRSKPIQPSVGRFPTLCNLLTGKLRPRSTRKYIKTPKIRCDIDWATGACLAFRRSVYEKLCGFDIGFFLDYEETDLCKRIANLNLRCIFEPEWSVIHVDPNAQRPPSVKRMFHTRRSLSRYMVKHRPNWEVGLLSLLYRVTLFTRSAKHPDYRAWVAGLKVLQNKKQIKSECDTMR